MPNLPLDEDDRRDFSASQLLEMARQHGIILTTQEQVRLSGSQLLELAKLGQNLTDSSRTRLRQSQRIELHKIAEQQRGIMREPTDSKNIFVVHGRNGKARAALFEFLRSLGLNPLEWSQVVAATGEASPYVGTVLSKGFELAQAIVVLMTPDDEARLKPDLWHEDEPDYETAFTGQARPNVLIEAGMALGICENRTLIVELGKLRPASDLFGRLVIRLNNSSQTRQDVADRLRTAGCDVNLEGKRDWHTAGDFDVPQGRTLTMSSNGESDSDGSANAKGNKEEGVRELRRYIEHLDKSFHSQLNEPFDETLGRQALSDIAKKLSTFCVRYNGFSDDETARLTRFMEQMKLLAGAPQGLLGTMVGAYQSSGRKLISELSNFVSLMLL